MLKLPDIEAILRSEYQALITRHPGSCEALRQYRNWGGSKIPWITVGIYAHLSEVSRLVLEALYLEEYDGGVVRVFCEEPLEFFYARKVQQDIARCTSLITEASRTFQLQLPSKLIPAEPFDLPKELGDGVTRAMLPIPPPLGSCEVPE